MVNHLDPFGQGRSILLGEVEWLDRSKDRFLACFGRCRATTDLIVKELHPGQRYMQADLDGPIQNPYI